MKNFTNLQACLYLGILKPRNTKTKLKKNSSSKIRATYLFKKTEGIPFSSRF